MTAPLIAKVIQPIVRGAVKTTIELGLQVRKITAKAAEDLQDIVAEKNAEMATAEIKKRPESSVNGLMNR
ncbi:MAG: DUF5132 domain-containing protein [Pseudonocardiaceae bacterium]